MELIFIQKTYLFKMLNKLYLSCIFSKSNKYINITKRQYTNFTNGIFPNNYQRNAINNNKILSTSISSKSLCKRLHYDIYKRKIHDSSYQVIIIQFLYILLYSYRLHNYLYNNNQIFVKFYQTHI